MKNNIYGLSNEEELFLKIMNDYINKKESSIPITVKWNELISIAYRHDVAGVIFHQLIKLIDNSDINVNQKINLFKAYSNASYRYDKRLKFLKEIDDEFNLNKIPYFMFKGIDIANLYPNPKLRTMGDSDILIHKKDEKKAHKCLLKLGWQVDIMAQNEWKYHKEDIELELHRKMMNYEPSNSKQQVEFFEKRWKHAIAEPNSIHYHLDWNYHFVYVITHLRKHFISCSAGFRQFMDITIIAKECFLDWDWIKKELSKMEMWEFAQSCFAFCEKWFGFIFPVEKAELSDEFYLESTKKIIFGGLFGTADEQNLMNYEVYKQRKHIKKIIDIHRLIEIGEELFPPYIVLQNNTRYSFVNKRPLLIPVAWGIRAYRFVFKKTLDKEKIEAVKSLTKEQINDRNIFLDKWKL